MPQSHFSFSSLFFTITWPALRIKQQLLFLQLIFSCSRDGTLFPQCSVPANNLWHLPHHIPSPNPLTVSQVCLSAKSSSNWRCPQGYRGQEAATQWGPGAKNIFTLSCACPQAPLSFIIIIFITTIIDRAFVYPSVIIFHCECLGY